MIVFVRECEWCELKSGFVFFWPMNHSQTKIKCREEERESVTINTTNMCNTKWTPTPSDDAENKVSWWPNWWSAHRVHKGPLLCVTSWPVSLLSCLSSAGLFPQYYHVCIISMPIIFNTLNITSKPVYQDTSIIQRKPWRKETLYWKHSQWDQSGCHRWLEISPYVSLIL